MKHRVIIPWCIKCAHLFRFLLYQDRPRTRKGIKEEKALKRLLNMNDDVSYCQEKLAEGNQFISRLNGRERFVLDYHHALFKVRIL